MIDESERPSGGEGTDAADGTVRARYEWSSTLPSIAVIETVAIAVNREPTTIEPLYDSVDPDALDVLMQSNEAPADADPVTVSFGFAGRLVAVYGTGEVVVRPVAPDS